jgi:uncharacterized membrane protein YebE (DUF533 family)
MKAIAAVCVTLAMFITISPAAEATPIGQSTPVSSTQPIDDGGAEAMTISVAAGVVVGVAAVSAFAYGVYRGYQTDPVEEPKESQFARMMEETHQPMNFAKFDG